MERDRGKFGIKGAGGGGTASKRFEKNSCESQKRVKSIVTDD